jgi:hypothetical protein
MSDDRSPWGHHFDAAFDSMDRVFANLRHVATTDHQDARGRKIHTLTASTWRSRWAMFRLFSRLAWRILTRGRVTVKL